MVQLSIVAYSVCLLCKQCKNGCASSTSTINRRSNPIRKFDRQNSRQQSFYKKPYLKRSVSTRKSNDGRNPAGNCVLVRSRHHVLQRKPSKYLKQRFGY